jgi:hypothetical protein
LSAADQRLHKCDGVVLQPNRPYCCGLDVEAPLLKWKWDDTISVDLKAEIDEESLEAPMLSTRSGEMIRDSRLKLSCSGPNNTFIDLTEQVDTWCFINIGEK